MSSTRDLWARYFRPREWGEFLNTANLKAPQDAKNWLERLNDNLIFYFGNYVILAIVVILLIGVASGNKAFTISAIVFFFVFGVLATLLDDGFKVGNFALGMKEKLGIIAAEFLLSIYVTDSAATWAYALLLALIAILTHASLNKRSGLRPIQKEVDSIRFHVEKMGESLAETNKKLE